MSRFGITQFVITETPWSSVIFKTIMVPLHRRRLLVVHLYSGFCMDPSIFSWGQIYTKNCYFFAILTAVRPHFQSHNGESLHNRGDLGDLPHTKFCKNCLRGYTPFGQIYTKNTNFCDFGGSKPTFLKPQRKNLAWGCNPGRPSPMQNSVKIR